MIAAIWSAMPWILAACVVIWVIAVTIGILILLACTCREAWAAVRDWWLRARAVIEETREELGEEPEPYWPAGDVPVPPCPCPPGCQCPRSTVSEHAALLAALCNPCQGGDGACICITPCKGEPACVGGFSDEDVQFLRGLRMEGTGQ